MSYFFVRSNEDGILIEEVSKEQLLKYIQPDQYLNYYYGSELIFIESIPPSDKGHWYNCPENAAILIKGKIIIPKSKQVVTKYIIED